MSRIEKVSVIGAGIMGAGIANAIFKQKFQVKLFDAESNVAEAAVANIKKTARKSMDPEKIIFAPTLEEAAKDTDIIIEAIIENMDIKCKVFSQLNEMAGEHTIFASNTSSLNISEMARASNRPDKFVGLHFFNPAIIMRLVEIIVPELASTNTYELAKTFVDEIKRTGIKCKESPGFVVNRILIPIINEAFYLLEEKTKGGDDVVAVANDVDSAIVKENILLMGPYDLADLTGIDTGYRVSEVIYSGFNQNPRYIPSEYMKKFMDDGHFGRKAKRGVYHYENQANDPDANPCLDANAAKVERLENPKFNTFELASVMANESFRVLEEGIVEDFNDIETCMELGTRWPKGPFALTKSIGLESVRKFLQDRYAATGNNPRYEPSGLLMKLSPELEKFYSEG